MKITRSIRHALSISAVAVLAACGGSQSQIGAALPKSPAGVATADHRAYRLTSNEAFPSWMRHGAQHDDLLYVDRDVISVLTYPQGKIVGGLSGVGGAADGECADRRGDVFVTDQSYARLDEFAHGRTGKIAELQTDRVAPISCSIDPTTGDLAAAGHTRAR